MARALRALDKRGPLKQRLLIELEFVEHDVKALKGAVTCSGVKGPRTPADGAAGAGR